MYPVVLHKLDLNDIDCKQTHRIWIQPNQITAVRAKQTNFVDVVNGEWVPKSVVHGSIDIDGEEISVRETLPQICLAVLSAVRKGIIQSHGGHAMKLKTVVFEMDLYYSRFFESDWSSCGPNKIREEDIL